MWSRFRDKIVRTDDRQRVRGKNGVNSLNELLLSSKEIPIFCRTYRDLSHKDFLISFHPFSIGDFSWQRALFCGALGCAPGSVRRPCYCMSWWAGGTLVMKPVLMGWCPSRKCIFNEEVLRY